MERLTHWNESLGKYTSETTRGAHSRIAQRLGAYENTGLMPEQVAQLSADCQHWANEARLLAAAAGELRIKLAERLQLIQQRKVVISDLSRESRTDIDEVVLNWKLMQFEEQEAWLEGVLYGERDSKEAQTDH